MTRPTILACTDGSIYADSVYDHAAWAAKRLNAALYVLHMLAPEEDPMALKNFSGSIGLDARQRLKEDLVALAEAKGRVAQAKARAILDAAKAHLAAAGIAEVKLEAKHGSLAESITDYEADAELVVLGKRGEAANFEKMHLGANVERVIRSCHHPVLVASRAFQPIEKVVVAYDGGASAHKAIDYIAQSPLFAGLECHILTVGKPHQRVTQFLPEAGQQLKAAGLSVTEHHFAGQPEEVFAAFIAEHNIDLLVMGAYGHSRIRQLMIGSTTTTMVRTCRIPVMMFR